MTPAQGLPPLQEPEQLCRIVRIYAGHRFMEGVATERAADADMTAYQSKAAEAYTLFLDEVTAYALAAVAQERERAAKLVESQKFWEVVPELAANIGAADVLSDMLNFQIYGPVAAAIRAGRE